MQDVRGHQELAELLSGGSEQQQLVVISRYSIQFCCKLVCAEVIWHLRLYQLQAAKAWV